VPGTEPQRRTQPGSEAHEEELQRTDAKAGHEGYASMAGCALRTAVVWVVSLAVVMAVTYWVSSAGAPEWLTVVVFFSAAGGMYAAMQKAMNSK